MNWTWTDLLLLIALSSAPLVNGWGASASPFRVWPFNDCPSTDPPARRATWGGGEESGMTAEGRPDRGDDGDEARAGVTAGAKRRDPRRGGRPRAATRHPKELVRARQHVAAQGRGRMRAF